MSLPRIQPYDLPAQHETLRSRGPWQLVADRVALLIHDMQNYFIDAYTPGSSPIAPAIDNMRRIATLARAHGIPVFYTCQQGDQDRRDRGLQADLWGPGMSSAAEHQAVVAALTPTATDLVLTKHRYSAFQRSNLETLLRARGRDQLAICGVYAHIGCLMTAAEAFQRDIVPFFITDATADFSREHHDMAVTYVAQRCGVALNSRQFEACLQ
jgi:bifunctional isochorismate lyase/aryl carrier protein